MNSKLFIIPTAVVLLFGAALFVQAQELDMKPKMRFSEQTFDMGQLLQGEYYEKTVEITNDGGAPLRIFKIEPTCSCTTIPHFDEVIKPGTTGTIQVHINSKKIKAEKNVKKGFKITTNDEHFKQYTYIFTGEVVRMWQTRPEKMEMRGVYDQEKELTVDLLTANQLGFEIIEAKSRNGYFEILSLEEVQKDQRYRARLRAKPWTRPETIKDPFDLTIKVKDGRTVTVGNWVYVEHLERIIYGPQSIRFKNQDTNRLLRDDSKPVTKSISVEAISPEINFKITNVSLEGNIKDCLTTRIDTLVPGRKYNVVVLLSEYQAKTFLNGKLNIETDCPDLPKVQANVQAMFGKKRRRRKG